MRIPLYNGGYWSKNREILEIRLRQQCWSSRQGSWCFVFALRYWDNLKKNWLVFLWRIYFIFGTFLQRGIVVTYFWDVFFGGTEATGTLWTWIKEVIMCNNFESQKLSKAGKELEFTKTTSFLQIGFWESNYLGISSTVLPLNTLGVLITYDFKRNYNTWCSELFKLNYLKKDHNTWCPDHFKLKKLQSWN